MGPVIEKAYGLLWRDTNSGFAHAARKLLLSIIDKDGQKRGIDYALKERPKSPIAVTGIWLKNIGTDVIVEAEIEGQWVEVIRERSDGIFSHIVEPGGMLNAYLANLVAARSSEMEAGRNG